METLGLTTADFKNPTRGINLNSFTNIGISEKDFVKKYGNGKYAILTKGEMAQLITASNKFSDEIQKGEDGLTVDTVLLKTEQVLVELEKGGQSLVFCIEKPPVDTISKAEDNNIEKAVMGYDTGKIQFKKTGKEIKEKLATIKTNIATKLTEVAVQLATLQVAIGFEPTEMANEWWYRGNYKAKVGEYLVYPDDKCYFSTGDYNYGSVNGNLTKETCDQCRQYNRAISNVIDLKCDSAECDTFIDNLVDTETYTLSADQLVRIGF